MLGKGDGTFESAVDYPAGNTLHTIATGDLDGDGHLDLVAGGGTRFVRVLAGSGDGTFRHRVADRVVRCPH